MNGTFEISLGFISQPTNTESVALERGEQAWGDGGSRGKGQKRGGKLMCCRYFEGRDF